MKQIIALLFFCILVNIASGQVYSTPSSHAEVHGTASFAPDYTGVSDLLEGTIDLNTGAIAFRLPLKTLKTGNSKRDRDMYETIEVSEFPEARFEGDLQGYDPEREGEQQVIAAGYFTMHGQSRYLEVPGTLELTAQGLKFEASFDINITDFGIERRSVLFSRIDDRHRIRVNGLAREADQNMSLH